MPKTRRFTNPTTGGRIVVKAAMSQEKHDKLTRLLTAHGYQEISPAAPTSPPHGDHQPTGDPQ